MTSPVPRQPYPWLPTDLLRWFSMLGLSAVGLVVAWWGASGATTTSTLITWINVGGAAIVVGGLANMRWLLQGRRAVAMRRRALLRLPATSLATDPYPVEPGETRVAVPGATRHHRPDCAAVAGKPVKRMSVARHERAGRRPCGLCDR